MNIYYIDYENVTSQGLKGVDALTENDEVVLLYSKKADNVKIEMLTMLMASKAKIRFLPVHVGTPNALDFQLVTLLFLNYKDSDHCYIISKDSGYDCCIKTAAENGAPNVARYPNIESAVKGIPAKKTRRGKRTAQESLIDTSAAAKKDPAKDTGKDAGKDAVQSTVAKSESNPEPQIDSSQSPKEEKAAAEAQPAKPKTSQNQKSRSRRQNAKNQSGQNKDAQNLNAQSSAPDQVKTSAEDAAMTHAQMNEQPKYQNRNNTHEQKPSTTQNSSQEQKPVQAQNHSHEQKPTMVQEHSQEQKPAMVQEHLKDQIPAHGQSKAEDQDLHSEQDPTQVKSQAQSQTQGDTPDMDPKNPESPQQDSDSSAPEETQKKKSSRRRGRKKTTSSDNESNEHSENAQVQEQTDVPEQKESAVTNNNAPAEHVLQQRYLSKQFEPKGLQADKARSEAEKPVSILSVIRRRNDVQLDMHQVDLIRSALKESGNKQQFYSYFVKNLGQKQGIELYHSIKSSYTDLMNANLL